MDQERKTEGMGTERARLERTAQFDEPHDCKEGNPMKLFFSAFVGGLVGTGLMDVAEIMMERLRLTSGSG